MAQKENFFQNPVDRTPYAGCVWVAIIIVAVFLLSATLLWKAAGAVKHSKLFHFDSKPSSQGSDLIQKVQDAASGAKPDLNKATEDAKQKAQQAVKEEADRQIQTQIDNAKEQGSSELKQYFSQ